MNLIFIEQKDRDNNVLDILLKVWESSVRDTHVFLSENNIRDLIPKVKEGIKIIEKLFVIIDETNTYCAFMGISKNKIEMLFVGAEFRGKGIGRKLINYAIDILNVLYVDVNEQNDQAIGFYKKYGFRLLNRSEQDDYRNLFPILHLGRIK
ncbi:MAG: GNAT family N-acetyltransferase [Treponema sp.]|jgi:putative acetyltransferase|nr:GNAT family N-acetyltransferase [Treponema sp.]